MLAGLLTGPLARSAGAPDPNPAPFSGGDPGLFARGEVGIDLSRASRRRVLAADAVEHHVLERFLQGFGDLRRQGKFGARRPEDLVGENVVRELFVKIRARLDD
jgi:hypothetical protein